MKQTLLLLLLCCSTHLVAWSQPQELYVFKDERKEHLAEARRERAEAREKKVYQDFFMRVRTIASMNEARVEINMKKTHDAEVIIADMNGQFLASMHKGSLDEGTHEFSYIPEGTLRKPFVCRLVIDGKTEAMRVVKFNSF
jgi:hypothetical protein